MGAMSRGYKSTAPSAFGPARAWFIGLSCLTLCSAIRVEALTAVDDQAGTFQNTAISIPVLTNDCAAGSNQVAILHVTSPSHGKVAIDSGVVPAPPELTSLFQFAAVQLS